MCNDAQILLQLFCGHANTIINNSEGTGILIRLQLDVEFITGNADLLIGE